MIGGLRIRPTHAFVPLQCSVVDSIHCPTNDGYIQLLDSTYRNEKILTLGISIEELFPDDFKK